MRRLVIAAVAGLVLVGCGGSGHDDPRRTDCNKMIQQATGFWTSGEMTEGELHQFIAEVNKLPGCERGGGGSSSDTPTTTTIDGFCGLWNDEATHSDDNPHIRAYNDSMRGVDCPPSYTVATLPD